MPATPKTKQPPMVATYVLTTGLFQEFGLPEAVQIAADGTIRCQYWHTEDVEPCQHPQRKRHAQLRHQPRSTPLWVGNPKDWDSYGTSLAHRWSVRNQAAEWS